MVRTPSAVMNIGMIVLFPLTFASNVFVDPETMPAWLRAFVNDNPVTHLVNSGPRTDGGYRGVRGDCLGAAHRLRRSSRCSRRSTMVRYGRKT